MLDEPKKYEPGTVVFVGSNANALITIQRMFENCIPKHLKGSIDDPPPTAIFRLMMTSIPNPSSPPRKFCW
jgi:hypothetical protein